MTLEFLSMVTERDPELAELLAGRIEQMQAADAELIETAESELAELRRVRPRFRSELRDGYSIDELFHSSALPDPELVEDHMRLGLEGWRIVERLERRHHE